ncbi:MAG TPA: hypothetical protein PKH69_10125 [Thiobacillaceae bacterium]|nr:hypothetical protein [Thiobacillaceae bacterium]HNU64833.1 hypothetical protein [Thiobacillaceae bacterium]
MERSDSHLRDSLLALPTWAAYTAIGLLAGGVVVGLVLLLASGMDDTLRAAGGQLLVVSLPVLSVSIGVLGASWSRTGRIDTLVADYLRKTVGDKLEAYLLPAKKGKDGPFPALFERMERDFRPDIASYCHYHLYDRRGRRFDLLVKANVFNIEISLGLRLSAPPSGFTDAHLDQHDNFGSLDEWPSASVHPLVGLAPLTLHGCLAEGYTLYLEGCRLPDGGMKVNVRLRQKLQDNFLTSPYLRRYFAEDAAIATYFFYSEAFGGKAHITGGEF